MKLYVASSWKNDRFPAVLEYLTGQGFECYNFRNPAPGNHGFSWSVIDPNWQDWTTEQYVNALDTPVAREGFGLDRAGMEWADGCVLVLPCGRSAHVEAGIMIGWNKPTVILLEPDTKPTPDLMYLFAGCITDDMGQASDWLKGDR